MKNGNPALALNESASHPILQNSNDYPGTCIGTSDVLVGREASFGVKPSAGQCDGSDPSAFNLYFLKVGKCFHICFVLQTTATWAAGSRSQPRDCALLVPS